MIEFKTNIPVYDFMSLMLMMRAAYTQNGDQSDYLNLSLEDRLALLEYVVQDFLYNQMSIDNIQQGIKAFKRNHAKLDVF